MHERFDELTRILGSGLSRRETLRLIAGAAFSALFPQAAWGDPRNGCPQKFCPNCVQQSLKVCVPGNRNLIMECFYLDADPCKEKTQACICLPPAPAEKCPEERPVCATVEGTASCVHCRNSTDCKGGRLCCNFECCPKDQERCCKKECCSEQTPLCIADVCCPKNTKVVCEGKCCPKDQKECCGKKCCEEKQKCLEDTCCPKDTKVVCEGKCCPKNQKECCGGKCCDECDECKGGKCVPKKWAEKESRVEAITAADQTVQMSVIVRDQRGIGTITPVKLENATLDIPSFPEGATEVVVTATKIDSKKRAFVQLRVCPPASCECSNCCGLVDPVISELQVPPGGVRVRESFPDIPAFEHFVTVQNGSPGLRTVRFSVNGIRIGALRLAPNQVQTIDIARYMTAEPNLVTVAGEGQPGSRALILISDLPAGSGKLSDWTVPPRVRWETESRGPGVNLHWGS